MARIMIAGLGKLGWPLAERLRDAGHQVTALRRAAEAPAGVTLLAQDFSADEVRLPSEQVDLLVWVLTPGRREEAAYQQAFIDWPQRVLDALAKQQPLPPLVFVSSTAVYGEQSGEVSEQTPPRPEGVNGKILWQAEQTLAERTLFTAVRFSGIYNGQSQRETDIALKLLANPVLPNWKYSNRIHRADCVGILAAVCEGWLEGEMQPPVVVGTDAYAAPNGEVYEFLAQRAGEFLQLPRPAIIDGKKVRSEFIEAGHYVLQFPDFQKGFSSDV